MVYVTGDMHGDASRFSDPRLKKLKKGIRCLFAVILASSGMVAKQSKSF